MSITPEHMKRYKEVIKLGNINNFDITFDLGNEF